MKMLSEVMRPTSLDDLVQPARVIDALRKMATLGDVSNMLFWGAPGIGKTSAAHLLIQAVDAEYILVNGSLETGIDGVRDDIAQYCRCGSIFGQQKICFVDEVEFLSKQAQGGLRGVIEQSADRVRFLLTANEIGRLDPALRSRCVPINFDIMPDDFDEVRQRLDERYRTALETMGLELSRKRLTQIIHNFFPDLRRIANTIQVEAVPIPKAAA
jgi:replication-associated recombination protein RarA